MTPAGEVTKLWDFDAIFRSTIGAKGEDATKLVKNGSDWFHMNSAIYDASDDTIISSSRENFIVKTDYETGAIRWILGNTDKAWYQDYPSSLQPLTLACIGDAPIGQHSLSISDDGTLLTCFNNGAGHITLPDIGDSRSYSKVSVYSIDEAAGTAEEVLALDGGLNLFAPICSSAEPTHSGDVLALFTRPKGGAHSCLIVVDDDNGLLFQAWVVGGLPMSAHEFRPEGLQFD